MRNVSGYFDENNYLAHHGILGMKWGVRHETERNPVKEMQRVNNANANYISDLDRTLSSLNESMLSRGNAIIDQYSSMSLEDLYK